MNDARKHRSPIISGWRETLVSVADLNYWANFYCSFDHWEVKYSGSVAKDRLEYMRFENGGAREVLVGHSDASFGDVRFIQFDGAATTPVIRANGRPGDVGGWFDLNARVDNIADRSRQLSKLGWSAVSEPIQYNFASVTVKEWLAFGPDGVTLALIERIHPHLEAAAQPSMLGKHFNSAQFVADHAEARLFYEDTLGFTPTIDIKDEPMLPEPGPNVLGLPEETSNTQHWNVTMLKAPGDEGGNVEIISLPGHPGKNFAPLADPPNRGIISHLFPVDDIEALYAHLTRSKVDIVNPPSLLTLPPDGNIQLMTVRGPAGARLDFYQNI
jgi:hypothetical protein